MMTAFTVTTSVLAFTVTDVFYGDDIHSGMYGDDTCGDDIYGDSVIYSDNNVHDTCRDD